MRVPSLRAHLRSPLFCQVIIMPMIRKAKQFFHAPESGTHTSRVWRLSSITRVPWRKVIGVPGQR
jgi:hypothetical protein